MVAVKVFRLQSLTCECRGENCNICDTLGTLTPKMGGIKVSSGIKPNCKTGATIKAKGIVPLLLDEDAEDAFLFLYKGSQPMYKGGKLKYQSGTYEFAAIDPQYANCEMMASYTVKVEQRNLVNLTVAFLVRTAALVLAFIEGLINAFNNYLRSVFVVSKLYIQKFLGNRAGEVVDRKEADPSISETNVPDSDSLDTDDLDSNLPI